MVPKLHPQLLPFLKVPTRGDRPANSLLGPHRPVLLKCPRPLDRWLLDAGAFEDLVGALLEGEVALGGPGFVGCEFAVGVNDIVLDERILSPAVDGEVSGACRIVGPAILDLTVLAS